MPRILIADDNTNIQKMVSLAFEESGIEVVSVGNGEAAVRRLGELNPDLVLADIFMPVRNGYEVCEYVKKNQRFSQVPVILLVGAFDPLDEKEARRVGADGILKKPFVPPDPLIAMVTSALEKNPKVAAELAKAKAAKEVAPEPAAPPVREPEVLKKREVKRLPEFPEPTGEEAKLVYGFGSGRRTLGEDVGQVLGEAPAPAAHADEAEDEESQVGTSHDWRRAAADFEVPEDIAKQPALPSDGSFSADFGAAPAAEPVHSKEFLEDIEEPKAESVARGIVAEVQTRVPRQEIFAESELESSETSIEEAMTDSVVAAKEDVAAPAIEEPPAASHAAEHEEGAHEVPAVEASSQPEASGGPGFRHWMDALAGGPSTILGSWVDVLKKKHEPAEEAESAAAAQSSAEGEDVAQQLSNADKPSVEAVLPEHFLTSVPAAPRAQEAFDVSANEVRGLDEKVFTEDQTQVEAWPAQPLHFDAPSAPLIEANAARAADLVDETPAVHVVPEPMLDAQDSGDAAKVLRDPGLIEPEAVHVRPEPLLESDEASAKPTQPIHSEKLAPVYSFFRNDAATLNEIAKRDNAQASAGQDQTSSGFESSLQEFNQRIPTAPPPNREALTAIPFLTPPPDFHTERRQEMDPETVDAIVQRVVEKLGPQLQELLSQNMKPLVENILQNELTKKD